MKISTITKEYT